MAPLVRGAAIALTLAPLGVAALALALLGYTAWIPDLGRPPLRPSALAHRLGTAAYGLAYLLALLRAPLGLLPYLVKLFIVLGLGIPYIATRSTYRRELLNMIGDAANLGLSAAVVAILVAPRHGALPALLYLSLGAECIRLAAERIPAAFSALWQLLPHRCVALALRGTVPRLLAPYCRYYALDDDERARYVLSALQRRAALDADLAARLSYVTSLRIVPRSHGLRGGQVRDVAAGAVFIHDLWTNDPWLLTGMAIRRSPWVFDPRWLARPFYYMSTANRLTTLCVLRHARYCPPYALFQFGHEIRVARLHACYALLRRLGLDAEARVDATGAFQPDQLMRWLQRYLRPGDTEPEPRPLYSDGEVLAELAHDAHGPTAREIAAGFVYPLPYVEEVLLPRLAANAPPREASAAARSASSR